MFNPLILFIMFKPYFFTALEKAKKAGCVIIPFHDVEQFVNYCNSVGFFVCGGAAVEDGQVIYL